MFDVLVVPVRLKFRAGIHGVKALFGERQKTDAQYGLQRRIPLDRRWWGPANTSQAFLSTDLSAQAGDKPLDDQFVFAGLFGVGCYVLLRLPIEVDQPIGGATFTSHSAFHGPQSDRTS